MQTSTSFKCSQALFFQSRVPIKFWYECMLTATYLINRTPSPFLRHKTPYEVLHGSPAECSILKVFGCLVFDLHSKHTRINFSQEPDYVFSWDIHSESKAINYLMFHQISFLYPGMCFMKRYSLFILL